MYQIILTMLRAFVLHIITKGGYLFLHATYGIDDRVLETFSCNTKYEVLSKWGRVLLCELRRRCIAKNKKTPFLSLNR